MIDFHLQCWNPNFYLYKCKSGYQLGEDGKTCIPHCYPTCKTCSEYSEEEDAQKYCQNENVPEQGELINQEENIPIQRPQVISREVVEEEPVMKTFHRNFEAQQEQ